MKLTLISLFGSLALSAFASAANTTQADLDSLFSSGENVVTQLTEFLSSNDLSSAEVAQVVKAAIKARPDQAREIYIAAQSLAPDSSDEVSTVYYQNSDTSGYGGSDAKGFDLSKDAKGFGEGVGDGSGDAPANGGDIMNFPTGNGVNPNLPSGSVNGATLSSPTGGVGTFPIGGGEPVIPSNSPGGQTPSVNESTIEVEPVTQP